MATCKLEDHNRGNERVELLAGHICTGTDDNANVVERGNGDHFSDNWFRESGRRVWHVVDGGIIVVAELLGRGFAVRAAVLDASPAGEAAHLGYMNGADERLTLVGGCDLDVDGSYDSAFAGADAVVHTAAKVRASRRAAERVARRSRRPVSPCIARAVGQE